jgi:hypothetical protein
MKLIVWAKQEFINKHVWIWETYISQTHSWTMYHALYDIQLIIPYQPSSRKGTRICSDENIRIDKNCITLRQKSKPDMVVSSISRLVQNNNTTHNYSLISINPAYQQTPYPAPYPHTSVPSPETPHDYTCF